MPYILQVVLYSDSDMRFLASDAYCSVDLRNACEFDSLGDAENAAMGLFKANEDVGTVGILENVAPDIYKMQNMFFRVTPDKD